MTTTAYDYDKQRWVQGAAARHLMVEQLEEELEILRSDRGPEYVRFLGLVETTVEQMISDRLTSLSVVRSVR